MRSRGPVLVVTGNQTLEDMYVCGFRNRRIFAISASSPGAAVALLDDLWPRAILLDLDDGTDPAERQPLLDAARPRAIPVLAIAPGTNPVERHHLDTFDAGFAALVSRRCTVDAIAGLLGRLEARESLPDHMQPAGRMP
jgi:hypothetical protein